MIHLDLQDFTVLLMNVVEKYLRRYLYTYIYIYKNILYKSSNTCTKV